MKRLVSAMILFILANIMIFYVGLGRFSGMIKPFTGGYLMHFITFFGLSFLLSLILVHEKINLMAPFTVCFLYSTFFAIAIEILQKVFTSYRVFSYYDVLAGMIGAAAYTIIGIVIYESKIFTRYWQRLN